MVNEVSIPNLRNYEVSIWTLQDRFLSVLKWFSLEQKGLILEPLITLKDDGTLEFSFSIPKFYKVGNDTMLNPMWHLIDETPLVANMHKLKVIFNKNIGLEIIDDLDSFIIKLNNLLLDLFYRPFNYTVEDFKDKNVNEILLIIKAAITGLPNANSKFLRLKRELNLEEVVLEFLVISVTESHSEDNIMIDVAAEGLAFHELGKIGYKIVLSPDDFTNESEEWFKGKVATEEPLLDIHYWNKKIFGEDDNLITNWKYRVDMDWSSHSHADLRRSDQVYEDEYVSSWQAQDNEMVARYVEGLRVKWRSIDVKESNIYNITLTIAETFGVFCRYEYEHDVNYLITGRTVVYYNNYVRDRLNHFDLTYPYSSSSIQRTIDTSNITTKLFVRAIDSDALGAESITIMDVDANKSKEDYLLNFDYLHKIGTITDEQYAEVSKYEARLFTINSKIHFLRERIDLVEALKLVWEAKLKTASDALQLDKDRELAARDAKSALTDDEGEIPYEKTFAAIPATDREGYYYISAPVKGIKENTIHLYSEYDMAKKKPKQESEIFNYSIVRDEFGEVSKIGFSASEIRSGWLVCKYDPHLYYDTVITTWVNRAILDAQDLKKATEEIVKLNYWLYGTLVGFARADYSYTDKEYMEAGYCDGLIRVDTNEAVFSYVGNCRVVPESMGKNPNTGLVDMTSINDYLATPNLYYNLNYYLTNKLQIINAFNKMMGPALREGYWQPENYNDYGDVYKDQFLLYPHLDGVNRYLTNYEKPDENGHVSFIWDWQELYDNEEPFIYLSTIDGKMELYIAINLTPYMDIIKDHIKDLTFFYYDRGVLETIYGILKKISEETYDLYTREVEGTLGVDCSALYNAAQGVLSQLNTFVNSVSNAHSNFLKETLIRFCDIINNSSFNSVENNNIILGNLSIKLLQETNETADAYRKTAEEWGESYLASYNEYKGALDFYEAYWDRLYNALKNSNIIEHLIQYGANPTDTVTIALSNADRVLTTICSNIEFFNPTLDRVIVDKYCNIVAEELGNKTGFQLKFVKTYVDTLLPAYIYFTSLSYWGYFYLKGYLDVIYNATTIIMNRRNSLLLDVQYGWIESLVKNGLRTLTVGSLCELGWIIDANNMLDNNGNVISEPIPVLILTDAKNLDDKTRQYLATGQFDYEYYTGDEVSGIEYHTIPLNVYVNMPEYLSFIGYYNIIKDEDDNVQEVVPTKLLNINYENVIYNSIEPQNLLYPTFAEYRYRKVYPRLYFDTLKLKNDSSELYIQLNGKNLTNNEDYYTLSDDRSEGLNVIGLGYYTTLKPHTLYQFGKKQITIDLLYSLSNVDVAIYLDAIVVMKENAFPKVSYNVELSILNPEIILNAYNCLTLIVSINDVELLLEDVNGYISSIVMSLDKAWEDLVEIKNYETKFEDLFSTIVALTEAMKKSENGLNTAISAFTANGLIKPYILLNSMRTANLLQLYYGGTLSISEKDGIIATADNNAGVIAIRGNGIFTATEQDANGEWKWNTGILPSGINANLITTGQLDTNLIRIYSGDDLSFQWDGDGLYAYRSLYDNRILDEDDKYLEVVDTINSTEARQESLKSGTLDYKQYVKYDGTGLTLIAEKGVFIPKKRTNYGDGSYTYIYDGLLENTVERVKISWDGLILRNWTGERTFYADPDTGDLTLIGKITANSGSIAGWTILADSLLKEGIGLYSDTLDYGPGIVLSDQQLQTIETVIGDTPYYTYKDKNNTNLKYYLNRSSTTEITLSPNDIVYKYQQEIVSVEPKYQISAANVLSGTLSENNVTDGVVVSNSATEVNTIIYVGENASTPMLYNGESIVYDFNNIPDVTRNDWYNKVRQVTGSTYKNYVNEIEGYNYVPINVQNLPGNNAYSTLTLQPDITGKPTFSVYARDGATTIRKGTIGNFTIEDNALRGGTLLGTKIDNSSYFVANGSTERFDKLFYDIQADSANGVLTLTRINGEQVNFNIAAMQAYKNAIAAASLISLTLTSQDGVVIATATNSKGVTVTKSVNISDVGSGTITAIATSGNGVQVTKSITVEYGGVPDIGTVPSGCSGCTDQCKGGCGYSCLKICSHNCVGNCGTECALGCGGQCEMGCTSSCQGTCELECVSCGGQCSDVCRGTCGNGCGSSCSVACQGRCGDNCGGNCVYANFWNGAS